MGVDWIYGFGTGNYWWDYRNGNSGTNIKIKGTMDDWKAQVAEKTFIGALALAGAWLVKKSKPAWKWAVRQSSIGDRIEKLEIDLSIERSSRLAALKAATDPVYVIDPTGNMTFANPAFMAMTGFSSVEDAYGVGFLQAIHPDDIKQVKMIEEDLIKHPSSIEKNVRWVHRKTGEVTHTICRSELIKDKNGVLIERLGRIFILR